MPIAEKGSMNPELKSCGSGIIDGSTCYILLRHDCGVTVRHDDSGVRWVKIYPLPPRIWCCLRLEFCFEVRGFRVMGTVSCSSNFLMTLNNLMHV
jgi:hypothetical protein